MTDKVRVIVFGGCGFIGRYIVTELVRTNVASYIRIVDKVPPEMAWLNPSDKEIFQDPIIHFKSANLIKKESCELALGEEQFDWAINAAGETKSGQAEAVYEEGILKLSSNILSVVASRGIGVYLEISSGQMNSTNEKPLKEDDNVIPWSTVAKFKCEVEKVIKSTPGLNWIIVRPAIVYGPGDKHGLTPRMLVAAISKYLGTEMKLLWDQSLKMNTVHVRDVARAIVWLCQKGNTKQIYNLVDEGQSTQDSITKLIASIFNVEYEFCGNMLSKLAMSEGSETVYYVNEKHLEPWLKICTNNNLHNTPLTPYIDIESLLNKHLALDGSKIRKGGFEYKYPTPTVSHFTEILDDFITMNLLPKNIYSSNFQSSEATSAE